MQKLSLLFKKKRDRLLKRDVFQILTNVNCKIVDQCWYEREVPGPTIILNMLHN